MEKLISTGKTVDEAIGIALKQLKVTKDKVNIKVIEEPGKKLFGLLGKKDAVVEVEIFFDPIEEAKAFLTNVLKAMNLSVQIEQSRQENQVVLNLVGRDIGVLIGRRGQTLDSLQYLVNIVSNRHSNDKKIQFLLDAENYRSKRKFTLEKLALRLADKVIKTGKDIVLEPMTPLERKIIHTKLQDHARVETFSQGEEPYRKVVISKK